MNDGSHLFLAAAIVLILIHVAANIRLSIDVFNWVLGGKQRSGFLALVWLLPFLGAAIVYRKLKPEWFTPERSDEPKQSVVSAGLMGLDTIFNPSTGNIAEAQKKGELTIKAEGEMYNRKLPDFVEIEPDDKKS